MESDYYSKQDKNHIDFMVEEEQNNCIFLGIIGVIGSAELGYELHKHGKALVTLNKNKNAVKQFTKTHQEELATVFDLEKNISTINSLKRGSSVDKQGSFYQNALEQKILYETQLAQETSSGVGKEYVQLKKIANDSAYGFSATELTHLGALILGAYAVQYALKGLWYHVPRYRNLLWSKKNPQ